MTFTQRGGNELNHPLCANEPGDSPKKCVVCLVKKLIRTRPEAVDLGPNLRTFDAF